MTLTVRSRAAAALSAVALVLTLGACNDKKQNPDVAENSRLPAGELRELVPQPAEVPNGLGLVLDQSGPADITKLSSFSGDPAASRTTLAQHGFQVGYVVEYADANTGRTITVVVSRFATALGATDDLAADLSGKLPSGAQALLIPQIGDQSGGTTQPLPDSSVAGATLVIVRFRVADTTWLVAVGANGSIDQSAVTTIANNLAARAKKAATASPSPRS